jgi:glycosyltransferase involved in cell wall biosynthesis
MALTNCHAVAFIHGRPAPHPIHTKFAQSVNAEFHLVDFVLRWHDVQVSPVKRYLSWFICAILFPNRSKYSVFMTEGLHFPPAIMKWLRMLGRKQKIVGLLSDEALYFMYSGFYSGTTSKAMGKLLKSYDALICCGDMETYLARNLLGNAKTKIYTAFNGVSAERIKALGVLKPELESYNIVFIANGPSGWRGWYKGVDLLLQAFENACEIIPELTLTIIGNWEKEYIQGEILKYCKKSGLRL